MKAADYFRATTKGKATRQRSANAFATLTLLRGKLGKEAPTTARAVRAKTLAMRGLAYMISGFEREVVAWQLATDGDDDFYDARPHVPAEEARCQPLPTSVSPGAGRTTPCPAP